MKSRIPDYNKAPISNNIMHRNIRRLMDNNQMPETCTNAVLRLYDFMITKNYFGGCHALSSALYVALCKLGFSPELCVGECQVPGMLPFDHSWVNLDGRIIDLAVYYPLTQQINSISGPVILGVDAITNRTPHTQYGINTGLPMSQQTMVAINSTFIEYMDNFPFGKEGLWSIVIDALPNTHLATVSDLRIRYKDVQRNFIR